MYCVYFCVLVGIAALLLRRRLAADGRPTERYVLILVALAGAGGLVTLIAGGIAFMVLTWPDKEPHAVALGVLVGAYLAGPAAGVVVAFWLANRTSPRRLFDERQLAADFDELGSPGPPNRIEPPN
jgi:NhaP-type Na+/H+ or K+/H+ antiporter